MKSIGEQIKKRRVELGLTQAALAKELGLTDKAISKWEVNEGNPDIAIISKLCKVLRVNTDYLMVGAHEYEEACVTNKIINLDALENQKDIKFVKDTLNNNYLNYYEFAYNAIINNKKEELFKILVDSNETSLAQDLLFAVNPKRKSEALNFFWKYTLAHQNNEYIRMLVKERSDVSEKENIGALEDNGIINYLKSIRSIIFNEIKDKIEEYQKLEEERKARVKAVAGLTKDYFKKLQKEGNDEMFIIRLCNLLDEIYRYEYNIKGEDFSERMSNYFSEHENDELKDLFNRLRIKRNNIVHCEINEIEPLSREELKECLDSVFAIKNKGE
ncbi:MAG: helix-turn-helix domain-containing protein [Bacilli bacterium]|nr:helix-turn-helix domain-containing protein [Bacilli bacterium]